MCCILCLLIQSGGTGFIGRHLSHRLRGNQCQVINVSRNCRPGHMSWQDVAKQGIPDNIRAVINLAGCQFMDFTKRWNTSFKQKVRNSRVLTTRALAKCINETKIKPKVFVLVAGVAAYEPSNVNKYDESSPTTGTDFFSKLTVDMEKAAIVQPPCRLVIIRSGVVLGRSGGMVQNLIVPFFLGLGGRIGTGQQYLPWIHVHDLTRLIVFAIENQDVKGVLNGVAPQVITNEQFTKSFATALNRPAVIPVPEYLLNCLLHSERAMIMTRGQHVTPKRVLEYGFKYQYENIDVACKAALIRFFSAKKALKKEYCHKQLTKRSEILPKHIFMYKNVAKTRP